MNEDINAEKLADALDRYGANPVRWPQAMREAMPALLRSSPHARATLAEAQQLDAALDAVFAAAPAPLGLKTRILAKAPRREPWLDWLAVKLWRPVSLACVPLALGFALGMGVDEDTGDLEDSVLVAFSDAADFGIPADDLGDAP